MGFLITTSRRPTRRIRSFCKDLQRVLPNAVRVNRGKMSLIDVALKALEYNVDRIVLVSVFKGNPGKIRFFSVTRSSFVEIPPVISVLGVRLLREFENGRPIKVSSLIVTPVGGEGDLSEFSSLLADALKSEVVFPHDLDYFPIDTAFLRVNRDGDHLYTLMFVDRFGVPIGPLIRVKGVLLRFRGMEEVKFVEN